MNFRGGWGAFTNFWGHTISGWGIHYIYISCWVPVYRWSVMDKQVTSTPPIPENGGGGGSGYLYLHY